MQKILIVDDETPVVDALEKLFSTEQIRLVSADDRATAEELIRTEFFPVILADVRLRTESEGLRLLESIRRLSPRSKVASLTGYATPALEDLLKQHGVYVVLCKPVDFDELLRVVRGLLGAGDDELDGAEVQPCDLDEPYEKLGNLLYALPGRRYGLTVEETEEIVQEAWCLFIEKQALVRQPKAWLAGHLIAIEKRSYDDVSRQLGLPTGSIGPLYIRAKAKLKNVIESRL